MFRYKLFLLILVTFATGVLIHPRALAEEESQQDFKDWFSNSTQTAHWSVSMGYTSWMENLSLKMNSASDNSGNADFLGNNITFSRWRGFSDSSRFAYLCESSLIFGSVTAGGQQTLSYQVSNLSFVALTGSWRWAYHVAPFVFLTTGPLFAVRSISYPTNSNSVSASSGSNFNYGIYADIRETLFEKFELSQGLGTLASNAGVIWSLSLGYLF